MVCWLFGALLLTDTARAHETRKHYPAAISQEELQNYFRHFPTTSAARLAIRDHWLFLTKECEKKLNAFSLRCMQRSTTTSCQSDSCSATQNTPRILCNSKPHYRIHSIPPLERWLSQINPVHILAQFYFLKIHFKIILPATSLFSLFFFFRFANRNFLCIFLLVHACCMPHPTRSPSFDLPINP